MQCVPENQASCPGGGGILGVGCPLLDCELGNNDLGQCECEQQFYINEDCTKGFLCTSNIPDNILYEGCMQTCREGEILLPDFVNRQWQCVPNQENLYRCPGNFRIECPNNDVGEDLDSSLCSCNGQLLVNNDCSQGFFCNSQVSGGGYFHSCPEGEVIDVNIRTWNWGCQPDVGQCPGLGGFRVGDCNQEPVIPPELQCDFLPYNPLGDCECGGEFFIGEGCRSSFYCSQEEPASGEARDSVGCFLTCDEGQHVFLDFATQSWECRNRSEGFICPGVLDSDCDNNFDVECHCANEIWVDADCSRAARCRREEENGESDYEEINCPAGQFVSVDFLTYTVSCAGTADNCPGVSLHFGCESEDVGGLTTTAAPTTADAWSHGPAVVLGTICLILLSLLAM